MRDNHALEWAGETKFARLFTEIVSQYADSQHIGSGKRTDREPLLRCDAQHVDGTFNMLRRNERLDWLKAPLTPHSCRILSNAKCLSEGVDVPTLDAVMFLNPRNSVVDVVQSVGRVMRLAPDKEYGYVILPIGIPADTTPEQALANNEKYKVVWQVLQALRAHDERFNAMVNQIELNKTNSGRLQIIGVSGFETDAEPGSQNPHGRQGMLTLPQIGEWRDAIYAKIVAKVGDRRYWEDWAKDVSVIADHHTTRINVLLGVLTDPSLRVSATFDDVLEGLRGNLNDGISRDDAIDMLAQHLITKPVFDALFEGSLSPRTTPSPASCKVCWTRSIHTVLTKKPRASISSMTAFGSGPKGSTTPRASRRSSRSCTRSSSKSPSLASPNPSESSTRQ